MGWSNSSSFLFGSSRMTNLDTRKLGSNWYKLNYVAGMPEEHLQHIKVLLANGVKIKKIVVGLDRFSFYSKYPHENIRRKPYPLGILNTLKFYQFYLWKKPSIFDRDIFYGRARLKKTLKTIGYGPYTWDKDEYNQKRIKENLDLKLLKLPVYPRTKKSNNLHLHKTVGVIEDIKNICEKHKINLIIFMQPFHYKNYLAMNHYEMDDYYQKLADVQPFYDFSGLNTVTTNNYYWTDVSHFITPVNDEIVKVIMGNSSMSHDFGKLVQSEMVKNHRINQRRTIYEKLPSLLEYDKKILVHPSLLGPPLFSFFGSDISSVIDQVNNGKRYNKKNLEIKVKKKAATLKLNPLHFAQPQNLVLKISIEAPFEAVLNVSADNSENETRLVYSKFLEDNDQDIYIPVKSEMFENGLSIELGAKEKKGIYEIKEIQIYSQKFID